MSRIKLALGTIALLTAFGVASAQEAPSWSFVEAGYIDFSPDNGGLSDNGWYAGGSFTLGKMFHIVAEYDDVGNYTFWNAGFGWHGALGEPGDLFVDVVWNDVSFDSSSGNSDDNGYQFSGGLRWKFGRWFEAKGAANWVDLDDAGSETTFEVEGLFWLLDNKLALGANWDMGDADTLKVFGRWSFGRK